MERAIYPSADSIGHTDSWGGSNSHDERTARGAFEHIEAWVNFCEEIERISSPVIAVFHDDSRHPGREAMIGEGMSRAVRAAGAVGLICDGCVRDIERLREMRFPVMGKGLTAHRGRIRFHRFQVPIQLAGMAVLPGDLIHADMNGAVVIPGELVTQTVDAARNVVSKESKLFAMISAPTYSVKQLRLWYGPPSKLPVVNIVTAETVAGQSERPRLGITIAYLTVRIELQPPLSRVSQAGGTALSSATPLVSAEPCLAV